MLGKAFLVDSSVAGVDHARYCIAEQVKEDDSLDLRSCLASPPMILIGKSSPFPVSRMT